MSEKQASDVPEEHRLDPSQLRWRCAGDVFGFETTADLESCPINIIGQPRAQEALEVGLASQGPGYNIFVTGLSGTGRLTTIKSFLDQLAGDQEPPDDVCFVFNFRSPEEPQALFLKAGAGRRLREGMDELTRELAEKTRHC